uniref:Uncharacterized protein n=1 Tax=Romanomermis culicivorax TaxID=13658 RepID=A0A915KQX5_ROMCU
MKFTIFESKHAMHWSNSALLLHVEPTMFRLYKPSIKLSGPFPINFKPNNYAS